MEYLGALYNLTLKTEILQDADAGASKAGMLRCAICGFRTMFEHRLRAHECDMEGSDRCDHRGKSFDDGNKPQVHNKSEHPCNEGFTCGYCNRLFAYKSGLIGTSRLCTGKLKVFHVSTVTRCLGTNIASRCMLLLYIKTLKITTVISVKIHLGKKITSRNTSNVYIRILRISGAITVLRRLGIMVT